MGVSVADIDFIVDLGLGLGVFAVEVDLYLGFRLDLGVVLGVWVDLGVGLGADLDEDL